MVLKPQRPVRAERRDRGNAPSTHTGGLSEDGMRWWNDGHMEIMHLCNAPNLRPLCRRALPLFRHIALTGRDTF